MHDRIAAMCNRRRIGPVLASVLCCAGCAAPQAIAQANLPDRETQLRQAERERTLNQTWVGRTRAELQREWGPPRVETFAPGRRQPHPTLLFYFDRDALGGCIDSFVLQRDERETISAYICR